MKKSISTIITFVLLISLCISLVGCATSNEEYLSRADWIKLLSEQFGLDEFVSTEAYYTDVTSDKEYYSYVQACADWGIISNELSSTFEPEKTATMEFVLETALKVANVNLDEISVVDAAIAEGLIVDDGYFNIRGKITTEKAAEILAWATVRYITTPKEEVLNVVIREDVVDITQENGILQLSESEYMVTKEVYDIFAIGDVVVFPGDEYNPSGVARKIISVKKNEDGTYMVETEQPALEEICEDLEISTTVIPEKENIILSEGVTFANGSTGLATMQDNYKAGYLTTMEEVSNSFQTCADKPKGLSFGLNINFTKGTVGISQSWKDFLGTGETIKIESSTPYVATTNKNLFEKKSMIPDKNLFGKDPYDNTEVIEAYKAGKLSLDELKKELDLSKEQHEQKVAYLTNKFSGGYNITGSVQINDLYIVPELKLEKILGIPTGIESLAITMNYDIKSSLAIKGEIKNDFAATVAVIPIPIAATGATVDLEFILFVNANGELSVTAEVSNMIKTEYANGLTKKTSDQTASVSANAELTLEFGPKFVADIKYFGVSIVDANIGVAVKFKMQGSGILSTNYSDNEESIIITRQTKCKTTTNAYFPIISVGIGIKPTSLANKLKITFSWTLVDEEKALNWKIHESEYVIWEETQTISKLVENTEENTQNQETTSNTENETVTGNENFIVNADYLKIGTYYMYLQLGEQNQVEVINIPSGYTESDIEWLTSDSSIVNVNKGTVSAILPGSAIITVRTKDGLYEAQCAVTVESEEQTFTPLEGDVYY